MTEIRKIYFSFLSKFGLALLVFSVCRLLFYALNYSYFSDVSAWSFIGGIRFDWMTITILYAPFLLLHLVVFSGKALKFLFHLSNTIAIALNCLDLEYYKFTLKRTTADLFTTAGIGNDIFNLIPVFITDYWYVFIITAMLILFSMVVYNKIENSKLELPGTKAYLLFLLPVLAFFAIGFRGGLQYRPLNIIQAGQYADAKNIPVVINTPFAILKSSYKEDLEERIYFNPKIAEEIFNPAQQYKNDSSTKPLNVVLIIAESFSKEYIGAFNEGKGYTPYLDKLMRESLVFENAFANGKKSIEALPSILSGIPTLMNTSYISSKYAANRIGSLGSVLAQKGYETVFFHGGENGTMGFKAFTQVSGIEEYVGRNEYPYKGDYDGNWGIFDEPFLQFAADNLNQRKKPFFATIFTLSSHHPYTIPEKHKERFNEGPLPILKSVEYADYSIHQFFETAKKMPWFEQTLFIITADHTSQNYLPAYNNKIGSYAIPIVYYAPNYLKPRVDSRVVQHNDIFPSTIDFIGIDDSLVAFGTSAFDTSKTSFSISYINGIYQLIEGDYCLQFDGENVVGLFNWKADKMLANNLVTMEENRKELLEEKIKAIIQQYSSRLIENRLTIK